MRMPWITATVVMSLALCPRSALGQDQSKDLVLPDKAIINIRTLAFSSDGRLLAAGAGELEEAGQVTVWDTKTLKVHFVHKVDCGVPVVAFSRDNKTLAVGSFSEHCYLLDAETGKVQGQLSGHAGAARGMAFAPDGQTLAVSSYDGSIHLWDYRAGKRLKKWAAHTDYAYCLVYSPDGPILASSSADDTVKLWEATTGKLLRTWKYSNLLRSIAFSPKGDCLATACWDGSLKLRDPHSDKVLANYREDRGVDWVAVHPSGKMLAIGPMSSTVQVVAADPRQATPDDAKRIQQLIALWDDDRIEIRDKASDELQMLGPITEPFLLKAQKESPLAEVRIRARQLRAALRTPPTLAKLQAHRQEVLCGCFAPDGQLLATGAKDGLVLLWDMGTYKLKAKLAWP